MFQFGPMNVHAKRAARAKATEYGAAWRARERGRERKRESARVVFQFGLTCSCQATRAARARAAKCGAACCVPALDSSRQRAIRSSIEVEFRVELVLERGERVGQ